MPFFLSHHPECAKFKGHTLNYGVQGLCIGCFIGYPTAIITLFITRLLNLSNIVPSPILFSISLIGLGTLFFSFLGLTKNKKVKIIQKLLMGIGAALLFSWIMELPNSKGTNFRTAFVVSYILLTILNLYHAYGILSACYRCETPFNWGMCPGFCTIRERMEKNNLNNFLLEFERLSERIIEKRANKKHKSGN